MSVDVETSRAVAYRRELGAQQHAVNVREMQLRGSASAYLTLYAATRPLLPDEHQGQEIVYAWPDQAGAELSEGDYREQ